MSDSAQSEGVRLPVPAELDLKSATPLNPTNYEADVEFMSAVTGIKDPEELKQHILKVQADAYKVFPYPCIRHFAISRTKINKLPAYPKLLKLGKERKGAIFLEAACCVGNDLRRAVLDGFPADQIIGTDLYGGYWEVGHQLFKSTPETFPVKFLPGDIFERSFLDPDVKPESSTPSISTLTNLTPLVGRVSAIHASSFFHLFHEERQLQLAHLIASLLSPEPGSIIFGSHRGLPTKGLRVGTRNTSQTPQGISMFCHSAESWKELWEGVLGKGKVEVNATVEEAAESTDSVWSGENRKRYSLVWSVKRV